ncbi:S-adenosyl-L-methionine-dependent methyltransferase [Ascobolus immersus RN42]|uniref:rRNA adenine N(6)-methyltransferase n=1 Tax=Ascobolus immersus RN42 TaxID=1160509 RepID=A0A3N4HUK6_ASCIM|nr:S-adenosyl-L-methionine-dependent methyltransferase [Ascobolus immersus RN42]
MRPAFARAEILRKALVLRTTTSPLASQAARLALTNTRPFTISSPIFATAEKDAAPENVLERKKTTKEAVKPVEGEDSAVKKAPKSRTRKVKEELTNGEAPVKKVTGSRKKKVAEESAEGETLEKPTRKKKMAVEPGDGDEPVVKKTKRTTKKKTVGPVEGADLEESNERISDTVKVAVGTQSVDSPLLDEEGKGKKTKRKSTRKLEPVKRMAMEESLNTPSTQKTAAAEDVVDEADLKAEKLSFDYYLEQKLGQNLEQTAEQNHEQHHQQNLEQTAEQNHEQNHSQSLEQSAEQKIPQKKKRGPKPTTPTAIQKQLLEEAIEKIEAGVDPKDLDKGFARILVKEQAALQELHLTEKYGKSQSKRRPVLLKNHWPKRLPLVEPAFFGDKSAYKEARSQSPGWATADLLNEPLAEEVVNNIEGLEEWEGCYLIDMNPGIGIFSKALNRRLKPSKHILMEPREFYHPLLKKRFSESISADDSNILLTSLNGYRWGTYTVLEKDYGLDKIPVTSWDEGSDFNKKILFIGNCTMDQNGQRFATQLLDSIKTGEWLYKFGRVRFLTWVDDEFRHRILPGNMQHIQRYSFVADQHTETTEVAGVPIARVRKFIKSETPNAEKALISKGILMSGEKRRIKGTVQSRERAALPEPDKDIYDILSNMDEAEMKEKEESEQSVPEGLDDPNKPEVEVGRRDYKYIAYRDSVMLEEKGIKLQWDSRKREPVNLDYETDFCPPGEWGLLDFKPKPLHPWFCHTTDEERYLRSALYDWIVHHFYERKASTVVESLKYVYPGAIDILNYCEGSFDPMTTAVRCLTPDEMLEIAKAFRRWPFFKEEMIYQPDKITNDDDDVDSGSIEANFHSW